ncbi:MAG: DUF378 domain-containing protein [Clostridiales bacterium]|jgi:uncharacterized membrane protein YuzA (DUF378 family)|nr:DUF378 domain-containing protein [Clostridiales bacterium]
MDTFALILGIIGAINWGIYGIFKVDLIGAIFGGNTEVAARIAYGLIGLGGAWCISLLFRETEHAPVNDKH